MVVDCGTALRTRNAVVDLFFIPVIFIFPPAESMKGVVPLDVYPSSPLIRPFLFPSARFTAVVVEVEAVEGGEAARHN